MKQEVVDLQAQLTGMYAQVSSSVMEYAPKIVGAIVILVLGYIMASLFRIITRAVFSRFDPVIKKMLDRPHSPDEPATYANLLARIVFWIIILFFLTASVNFLGWKMASDGMASLIGYLPNFISGLLIIFIGFLVANLLKGATVQAAQSANIGQHELLGNGVRMMVLLTAFIIGVEQAGIDVQFISTILTVVIGLSCAGIALAFGLGGRDVAANFLGSQYAKKHFKVGENVRFGSVEGKLVDITHTSFVIDTPQGRVNMPTKAFMEAASGSR